MGNITRQYVISINVKEFICSQSTKTRLISLFKVLGKSNPDEFTQKEWDLIWAYTKSDGCTGVADIFLIACVEHDFYFRTHHDFG